MDFGDLQNYNTGKNAEDAANTARSNQREINNVKNIITSLHIAQETEKKLASGLYEPTEDAAERIANRYIKQPVDGYLDHSNYSALEYKELANKTKETYDQLLEMSGSSGLLLRFNLK